MTKQEKIAAAEAARAAKAAAKKAEAATSTYEVLGPLQHDGEAYDVGDTIELSVKQARPLLDVEAIAEMVEATPAAQ